MSRSFRKADIFRYCQSVSRPCSYVPDTIPRSLRAPDARLCDLPAQSISARESLLARHSVDGDGGLARDSHGLRTLFSSTAVRGAERGRTGLYTYIHMSIHGCVRLDLAWRFIGSNDNYSVACLALPANSGQRALTLRADRFRANRALQQGDFPRCLPRWSNVLRRVTTACPYVNEKAEHVVLTSVIVAGIAAVAYADKSVTSFSPASLYFLPLALSALVYPLRISVALSVVCLALHDLLSPVRDSGIRHLIRDAATLLGYVFVVVVVNRLAAQRRRLADLAAKQRDELANEI